MTYSLTEKEEILYEREIEELFTLTEKPIKYASAIWEPDPNAPEKVKYGGREVTQQELATLKKADATGHWTDRFDYDEPIEYPPIPAQVGYEPPGPGGGEDQEDDDGTDDNIPKIIPTIPSKVVKKPLPVKKTKIPKGLLPPSQRVKKLPLGKVVKNPKLLKHTPRFVAPSGRPYIPPKDSKKIASVKKPLLPSKEKVKKIASVKKDGKKVLPKKAEIKKITNKADDIIKKLTQKGQTAQAKINLRNRLKAIVNNHPHLLTSNKFKKLPSSELKLLQYDPLKGKPGALVKKSITGPAGSSDPLRITSPKVDSPELRNAKSLLSKAKPGTERYKILKQQVKALSGNLEDPNIKNQRLQARAASNAIRKADAEALAQRKAKQAAEKAAAQTAEKARLAQVAKDAKQAALKKSKVPPVDTNTAHLVGDDGKPIDKTQAQIDAEAKKEADKIKKKAKAVKEPTPQSKMAKGMVQPRKGEGIKAFAKRLKFDTVEEFEKANPKGVGVDKKTGNKFVKTGVSYINKQAAGVANELDNAKRALKRETSKPKSKQNKVRIDKLTDRLDSLSGKSAKASDMIKPKPKQLKDLRPKWDLGRNIDMTKMRASLAAGFGKKVAGKVASKAAYAIPVLNVAIIAYDIHELMIGTAGGAGNDVTIQSKYRLNDLKRMDAIINSEASIEEKREALKGLGTNGGVFWDVEGNRKWEKETHNWEESQIDPPMPFVDDNQKAFDPFKMSLKEMKKFIPQQVASGPYTQSDIEYIIQRTMQKKEYDLGPNRKKVNDVPAYFENYRAKLKLLESVKKTIPETNRVDAYKKVFALAIDVQENHLQAGGAFAFKHVNSNIPGKPDAGITPDSDADSHPGALPDDPGFLKNNALENAIASVRKDIEDEQIQQRADYEERKRREEEEPGFWQRGYDAVAGLFTGDDDEEPPIASQSIRPPEETGANKEVADTIAKSYMPSSTHFNQPIDGAPRNFGEYETLMQELSKESGVPIQMLRALGKRESGIHVGKKGTLSRWSPMGDHTHGTGASMGIFHVRSSKDGAAVEEYNDQNDTNYNWRDIATNPRLSATIGAWYFKFWLDQTGGDPIKAYMHYNGGPGGQYNRLARNNAEKYKEDLKYYTESKFIKKSAILEGIAKAA